MIEGMNNITFDFKRVNSGKATKVIDSCRFAVKLI